jgi:hypothetical protein
VPVPDRRARSCARGAGQVVTRDRPVGIRCALARLAVNLERDAGVAGQPLLQALRSGDDGGNCRAACGVVDDLWRTIERRLVGENDLLALGEAALQGGRAALRIDRLRIEDAVLDELAGLVVLGEAPKVRIRELAMAIAPALVGLQHVQERRQAPFLTLVQLFSRSASPAFTSKPKGGSPDLGYPAGTRTVRAVSGSPLCRCFLKLRSLSRVCTAAMINHGTPIGAPIASYRAFCASTLSHQRSTALACRERMGARSQRRW